MLAQVQSAALLGCDAEPVTVEVDASRGLPQWSLVGLAAVAVRESRERVAAALANAGYTVPPRRITVSLSPGDLRKDGTAFDLPIALATLAAVGVLDPQRLDGLVCLGELGLDGSVRAVRGCLAVARAMAARGNGARLVVPAGNADEAALVLSDRVVAAEALRTIVEAIRSASLTPWQRTTALDAMHARATECCSDIVGQPLSVRALEIAAAGAHSLALVGPPGAGKTMLARRLAGILPPLDDASALEVLTIQSIAGQLTSGLRRPARPFRAPHHTASAAALVGGGSPPRPGEVTLAHLGVLFLDEFSLFSRPALDALREPLEDGTVQIARAHGVVRFPSRAQVVIASNPCPCGYWGEPGHRCRCRGADLLRHAMRLSGPLFDRVDLHVRVGRVPLDALSSGQRGETSAQIAERVRCARDRQRARAAQGIGAAPINSALSPSALEHPAIISAVAWRSAARAAEHLRLSARGFHRLLRVARTIGDLADREIVGVEEVGEALRYRPAIDGAPDAADRPPSPIRSFVPDG
ncbi:MAG: YifB family Mg chelatase-like AAA ATPase [Gemmatimonadaceae bacterium]|jgi:magnesium chelatase family protein|nr:YifB family Mg chelatase-like AAA ATPase [Gemmatimonadaceae bacterium]